MTAGKKYKNRPDGGDGRRTITPVYREYTLCRSYPKSQVLTAVPEGTLIGPVLEIQNVKILDGSGIEVAIPSIANPPNSYVVTSRETERFVNEIRDHKGELRSSGELLTAEKGSNRSQESGALNSIKETCASSPTNFVGDSLSKTTVLPGSERKLITVEANPFPRSGLPSKVSKMMTKMVRHYDQDECEEDGSYHWETVKSLLLREFAQERARGLPTSIGFI